MVTQYNGLHCCSILPQDTGKAYEICKRLKPYKWHCAVVNAAVVNAAVNGRCQSSDYCALSQWLLLTHTALWTKWSRTILFISWCFCRLFEEVVWLTWIRKPVLFAALSLSLWKSSSCTRRPEPCAHLIFWAQAVWFPVAIKEDFRFVDNSLV